MIKAVEVKQRRKLIQAQHEDEYREDLVTLDREVYENEGPDMKEEMMDQLRDWCDIGTRLGRQGAQPLHSPLTARSLPPRRYIKFREREGAFPDFPPEEEEEEGADGGGGKADKKDKKDAKGKGDKKDAKKDGGKKGKKGDAGDGEEEEGRRRASSTC